VLQAGAVTEIHFGETVHLRDVADGDITHRTPQLVDALAREPVDDACPVAPRLDEARAGEDLQVLRRVGDALADLTRELIDRALALGEHIDDLRAPAVAKRPGHRREGVKERRLRGTRHIFKLSIELLKSNCR
jgi:hypothetical protein